MRGEVMVERRHPSTKLTYDDLLAMPDDGLRHEIIDGEHYVTASPVTRHQRISLLLSYVLVDYLEQHPIGEVFTAPFDVVLSIHDVVVPDLVYISNERAAQITSRNLQGAPDLAIEILSPSTRPRDQRLKRDLYARVGVQEYWLVDPDRNIIAVYRRSGSEFADPIELSKADALTTSLLPGLELPLARVFRK